MMSTPFDFKAQSQKLVDRIWRESPQAVNKELARSAIEVALRDAYARGREETQGGAAAPKRPFSKKMAKKTEAPTPCSHQWKEAFLDGRGVGVQCSACGLLQRDVQSICDHFFVKVGSEDVCVACRKSRRSLG